MDFSECSNCLECVGVIAVSSGVHILMLYSYVIVFFIPPALMKRFSGSAIKGDWEIITKRQKALNMVCRSVSLAVKMRM